MKLQEIRQIAKGVGVKAGVGRSKADIIRDIQAEEGNSTCYRNITDCRVLNCLWRGDCQAEKK